MSELNWIFEEMRKKIYEQGENCVVLVLGKVRKGKSFCSMTIAKSVDRRFDVEKNMVYTIQDFYKLYNDEATEQCSVVVEELGTKFDKRRFMSLQNVILSHTLQTFAYKRLLLILNCPSMAYVDSRLEPMVDFCFTVWKATKRGDKLRKTKFKVRRWSHNAELAKTYKKRPMYWVGRKRVFVNYVSIPVPPEYVIKEYHRHSHKFKKEYNKALEVELTEKMEDQKPQTKSEEDIANELIQNAGKYAKPYKGKPHISTSVISGLYPQLGIRKLQRVTSMVNLKVEAMSLSMA